ncbi:MAG: hypothetical protein GY716_18165 [bacterium]|nr:hypothetical protein [bacterium]
MSDQGNQGTGVPAVAIRDVIDELPVLRASGASERVEVYLRSSETDRVESDARGVPTRASGDERGLVVRLRDGDAVRSAAINRQSASSLRWAWERAVASSPVYEPAEPASVRATMRDGDARLEEPEPSRVAWLSEARSGLERSVPAGSGWVVAEAWIETASTREVWILDGEPVAERTRRRGWAMARLRDPGGATLPLLFTAARDWRSLSVDAWSGTLGERFEFDDAGKPGPRVAGLLLGPEAAATVVHALARSLHASPATEGAVVGPAWRLTDDPQAPRSLYGGTFDDACFPTSRKCLADGENVVATLAGPGHYRRPSFRDPPTPQPAHLTVKAADPPGPSHEPATPPRLIHRASTVSIHPVAPDRWILELPGSSTWVGVDPADLVRRCVRTFGPARRSHLGVETPALLFDGVRVS